MAARKSLGKRLGRSVAKKPETLKLDEVLVETPDVVEPPKSEIEPYEDSEGLMVDPVQEATHREKAQQENTWMKLRANRGWGDTQQVRVLTDFIRSKGLFPELTSYATKRR